MSIVELVLTILIKDFFTSEYEFYMIVLPAGILLPLRDLFTCLTIIYLYWFQFKAGQSQNLSEKAAVSCNTEFVNSKKDFLVSKKHIGLLLQSHDSCRKGDERSVGTIT